MRLDKYPKIGSTKLLDRPNQFGRHTRSPKKGPLKCYLCDSQATHRIDVQNSWMRGEDDVFLVCLPHLELARSGKWGEFYNTARDVGRWKDD
jgi:hypothetical protein